MGHRHCALGAIPPDKPAARVTPLGAHARQTLPDAIQMSHRRVTFGPVVAIERWIDRCTREIAGSSDPTAQVDYDDSNLLDRVKADQRTGTG
jgi:hypothetical protein